MSLASFLAKKIVSSILTILAILTLVFFLVRLTGDPFAELENDPRITPETLQALRRLYGMDKSVVEQYISYVHNMLIGEMGYSVKFSKPVFDAIMERLPYTLALLVPSITLSNYLAYKIGVEMGYRRGSRLDIITLALSNFLRATPYFWLAIIFLYVFSVQLGLFPLYGAISPGLSFPSFEWFVDYLWHYAIPFLVLVVRGTFIFVLYVRNSVIDILGEDYVAVARAKGLPEKAVKSSYVARNAMLPMITVMGLRYAFIIDGAILTETVFSYPGTGRLVFEAIINRDFWLLQGVMVILSISVVLANLIVDLLYALLDPRVRSQR
ncbi:putative oligopeptide ABC transporter, permease protein [Desulfurococcaceae archaeon AG1]|jgi:peptide/nickel transport system permease protein|nr:putative oligopeptide ABC transporter, permease protein [Desulfurococcaceae archaeon AG1]